MPLQHPRGPPSPSAPPTSSSPPVPGAPLRQNLPPAVLQSSSSPSTSTSSTTRMPGVPPHQQFKLHQNPHLLQQNQQQRLLLLQHLRNRMKNASDTTAVAVPYLPSYLRLSVLRHRFAFNASEIIQGPLPLPYFSASPESDSNLNTSVAGADADAESSFSVAVAGTDAGAASDAYGSDSGATNPAEAHRHIVISASPGTALDGMISAYEQRQQQQQQQNQHQAALSEASDSYPAVVVSRSRPNRDHVRQQAVPASNHPPVPVRNVHALIPPSSLLSNAAAGAQFFNNAEPMMLFPPHASSMLTADFDASGTINIPALRAHFEAHNQTNHRYPPINNPTNAAVAYSMLNSASSPPNSADRTVPHPNRLTINTSDLHLGGRSTVSPADNAAIVAAIAATAAVTAPSTVTSPLFVSPSVAFPQQSITSPASPSSPYHTHGDTNAQVSRAQLAHRQHHRLLQDLLSQQDQAVARSLFFHGGARQVPEQAVHANQAARRARPASPTQPVSPMIAILHNQILKAAEDDADRQAVINLSKNPPPHATSLGFSPPFVLGSSLFLQPYMCASVAAAAAAAAVTSGICYPHFISDVSLLVDRKLPNPSSAPQKFAAVGVDPSMTTSRPSTNIVLSHGDAKAEFHGVPEILTSNVIPTRTALALGGDANATAHVVAQLPDCYAAPASVASIAASAAASAAAAARASTLAVVHDINSHSTSSSSPANDFFGSTDDQSTSTRNTAGNASRLIRTSQSSSPSFFGFPDQRSYKQQNDGSFVTESLRLAGLGAGNLSDDPIHLPSAWNSDNKSDGIRIQNNGGAYYVGAGRTDNDAALVRSNYPAPPECGIYYFEVVILSKGRDGYIGVGFVTAEANTQRLPGWDLLTWGYHGDDGFKFEGGGKGSQYGPTFTTKDVIGCGINFYERTAFFTKNGLLIGEAFKDLPIGSPATAHVPISKELIEENILKLPQNQQLFMNGQLKHPSPVPSGATGAQRLAVYPCVGLRSPGEAVLVNFGAHTFVYDIDLHVNQERRRYWKILRGVHFKPEVNLRELVIGYLAHHGYTGTLDAFAADMEGNKADVQQLERQNETQQAQQEPLVGGMATDTPSDKKQKSQSSLIRGYMQQLVERSMIPLRKEITRLMLDGEVESVETLLEQCMPGLLLKRTDIYAELRVQGFLELIAKGKYSDAMLYGQKHLSAYLSHPCVAAAFALLGYTDPSLAPESTLLSPQRRRWLADQVHSAVLMYIGMPPIPVLERLAQIACVTGAEAARLASTPATVMNPYRDIINDCVSLLACSDPLTVVQGKGIRNGASASESSQTN